MTTIHASFIRTGDSSTPIHSFGGFLVFAKGLDANNTVKLQRSINSGVTWSDVATYSSDQTAAAIHESTIDAQHRLVCTAKEAPEVNGTPIRFKLTKETTNPALLAPT